MENKIDYKNDALTRRDFIKTTAGAALATTAVTMGHVNQAEPAEGEPAPVRSKEFSSSLAASPQRVEFPMTGADVFAKVCVEEGLAALFACPGNYSIIHAMANQGIRVFSGRHEGFMAHAADGFIRVSGELAACSGTEGPGFTNMITAVATASKARTPLLVLASNKSILNDDTEEIDDQHLYQQPITEGLKKWGKRIITPPRVYEYACDAFRQLKTGIPSPVHLDFPNEVAMAKFKDSGELLRYVDKSRYRTESKSGADPASVRAAIDLLRRADRPLIIAGTGVFYHEGIEVLKKFAEKTQIPVLEIGPMRGMFSDGHPLSAASAPWANAQKADVVMLVGRYFVGKELGIRPEAKLIRVEPDAGNIGRIVPVDLAIVSDEKAALEALYNEAPAMRHESWVSTVAAARRFTEKRETDMYGIGRNYTDAVHPAVIAKELADFLYRGKIPREQTVVGVGGYGIQRFVMSFLRAYRPGQGFRPTYGFGTIGADVSMSLGVATAVKFGYGYQTNFKGHPVVCVTSDAGFGIDGMEIETLAKYRLPVVVIVYNNDCWGTWADFRAYIKGRPAEQIHLFQEKLRYDKVAEALGAHGEYVARPEDFLPALERSYRVAATQSLPSVINCQGKKEFYLKDQYPPGFPPSVGMD